MLVDIIIIPDRLYHPDGRTLKRCDENHAVFSFGVWSFCPAWFIVEILFVKCKGWNWRPAGDGRTDRESE